MVSNRPIAAKNCGGIAVTVHVMPQLHPPGPIAPAPSNAFGAAPLRFARFAVTAPLRCGLMFLWSLLSEADLQGRLRSAKTIETKSLIRAERSRLALATAQRLGLDGEHGSGTADERAALPPPPAAVISAAPLPQPCLL